MHRSITLFLVVLLCLQAYVSALWIPQIFSSNMVLPRGMSSFCIKGRNQKTNVPILLTLKNSRTGVKSTYSSSVSSDNTFSTCFPTPSTLDTFSLTVANSTASIEFNNVVFGDVYLCSGQSNMQQVVSQTFNATNEIADSGNYPNLRLFYVPLELSYTPLEDFSNKTQWQVSSPKTVGGSAWSYFSAVCYYFGRDLYKSLQEQVPIGLVDSAWGGTYIQAWSSPDALKKCPTTNPKVKETFKVKAGPNPNQPSVLYNAMIHPFIFAGTQFKGVLWYQGESNSPAPNPYSCYLENMILDWRAKTNQNFAFFIVQLAAFENKNLFFPPIRFAQDIVARYCPNTYMATAIDLGDPKSDQGDIHPRNKQDISLRLLNQALFHVYGNTEVVPSSPMVQLNHINVTQTDNGYRIVIPFDYVKSELEYRDPVGCEEYSSCCKTISSNYNPFIVETADKQAVFPSNTYHLLDTIVLDVRTTGKPAYLFYAFENYPKCLLFDKVTNLPAFPIVAALN